MKNLLGRRVMVISDNENYNSFRNKKLIITNVAYNTDQHPGYDNGLKGSALCDFTDLDGNDIPLSLYEYEFTLI
jgi:hypothetical protein